MIMADLKTNYVDDVLDTTKNQLRKYQQIQNDDGTVSFVDVTEYTQVGTSFGAKDINDTNAAINDVNGKLEQKISFNIKEYIFSVVASSEPTIKTIDENDAFILSGYLEFQNQQLSIGYSSGGSTLKFQYIPSEKSIKIYSAWTGVIHVFIGIRTNDYS